MADDATMLGEVVIQTGYMTQRKADLTGSVAIANTSDLAQNPSTNALKSLQENCRVYLLLPMVAPVEMLRYRFADLRH